MPNPNIFILGAFAAAGSGLILWGWSIISRTRKARHWPHVEGIIEESTPATDADDLLPHIKFRYSIDGDTYTNIFDIPGNITPSREFTSRYLEKYPVGKKVQVYYNPHRPDRATLEPDISSDWMVFIIGLLVTLFAITALFFKF